MTSAKEPKLGQLSIIHSKGTLDWAYPTFILASTAAAMDKQVEIFFTFYGLQCALKETKHLRVSPVGNPAMKMQSPIGPEWLKQIDLNRHLPQLLWQLPGMERLATWGFKKTMLQNGQVPLAELRELCLELGVQMTACQMSVEMMNFREDEFIDGIEFAGAASYFAVSPEQQALFI
ncbi:DsrE/DsrF/DrsH-like family protein [Thiomicrorhabdus sp. 6S2-11]|jgi:peroxiredoxin family protein|uniref:DsrE/DsrF/DrsH-like family protein n=1 Tax=Thiomicrorhabdus marina TaxID=2818442 RepID=A0ABS3Q635_9GAMM|nr:DsrE/DsrF/DrsH-like family protein [Thiomicrorhabdus marina]MBO1927742.1 DsrE/DsrF/DrsH-like family protein [Thiomicrorhabdus marina]